MVRQVSSEEDLHNTILKSRLVIVAVYDSRGSSGRYISRLVEDLGKKLEPVFSVVIVDVADSPLLAKTLARDYPRLLLYIDGEKVWEQLGFFYVSSSDRYAIRRGILMALRSKGIKPSSLGVNLNF